jgi:hypothetical protein
VCSISTFCVPSCWLDASVCRLAWRPITLLRLSFSYLLLLSESLLPGMSVTGNQKGLPPGRACRLCVQLKRLAGGLRRIEGWELGHAAFDGVAQSFN